MSKMSRAASFAAAGCLLALTGMPGSAAASSSQSDFVWNSGPIRFVANNGQNECLSVHHRSRGVMLYPCNAAAGSTSNWTMEPYNNYGVFMLENDFFKGSCLDMNQSEVYLSKCDDADTGQLLYYNCDDKYLMGLGPTTKVTWWDDNTVSASHIVHSIKDAWIAQPQVPQSCR
ncbi:ricin-type beta-trefoil lectin domain protein [Streptomyces sp. NPDC055254]